MSHHTNHHICLFDGWLVGRLGGLLSVDWLVGWSVGLAVVQFYFIHNKNQRFNCSFPKTLKSKNIDEIFTLAVKFTPKKCLPDF